MTTTDTTISSLCRGDVISIVGKLERSSITILDVEVLDVLNEPRTRTIQYAVGPYHVGTISLVPGLTVIRETAKNTTKEAAE